VSNPEENLIREAWALSKINAEQWERYLIALDAYTNDRVERALRSPTAELHRTVGIAQQALEFALNMRGLDEAHDKIMRRDEKKI
jgi:hypothetical protein